MYPTSSDEGSGVVGKFSLTVPSARLAEFFLLPDLIVRLLYYIRVDDTHPIICRRSLWDLHCPQKVHCFLGDPIILGGNAPRL